ncbi:MAG: hypothetical protein IPN14_08580 [Bacteroidetes bacterium]|nr:hypothetical protein [Bacteroidota bacterium]
MFPERILVTIEEFNKQDGTVLFDFIDSNEYVLFTESIGAVSNLDKPTMVFLKNYNGRTIRENTIYSIELKTIQEWRAQLELNSDNIDSFLIGYNIDVLSTEQAIFMDSVSIDNLQGSLLLRYYMWGKGDDSKISFSQKGK